MRMRSTLAVLFTLALVPALALGNGVISATVTSGSDALWMVAQYDQQQQQRDTMKQRNQQQRDQQQRDRMMGQQQMNQTILAQDMMGKDVYNTQNEQIGTIEEIVFDEQHEQVSYVVLARGGFLGIGENMHAIPWSMVQYDKAEDQVIIPISKNVLEEKQGFGDQWPREAPHESELMGDMRNNRQQRGDMNQQQRRDQEYGYGDMDRNQRKEFSMRKASQMIGLEVKMAGMMGEQRDMMRDQQMDRRDRGQRDEGMYGEEGRYGEEHMMGMDEEMLRQAETVGSLTDLVLTGNGRLIFGVLDPNTDLLTDINQNQVLAVPWERINIMPQQEMAMANLSQQQASQLAIEEDQLQQLASPQFSQRLYSAVGMTGQEFAQRNGDRMRRDGERMMRNGDRYRDEMDRQRDRRTDRRDRRQQMGQADEMRKWSDFSQQCLGRNMDKSRQTVRGTVHNVGTLYTSPEAEAPDGLRFVVRTNDDQRITVYAGPRGEVSQQLNLYRGDQVTIRGARCEIENEQVFVASSIQTNGDQFELTQKNGTPHWESKNQQKQNQQKQQQKQGDRRY